MKKILAFVDTETTGLLKATGSVRQPYLTEICIIKTDHKFKIIDRFSTLINCPEPLPYFITKKTNITDEMLEDAPTFESLHKRLKRVFKGVDVFIGHNAMFDYRMIAEQCIRYDLKQFLPVLIECTVEKSLHIFGYRLKLDELYYLATKETSIQGHHRAEADVRATIKCYKWLTKQEKQNVSKY